MPTRPSHPEAQAAPANPTPSLPTRAFTLMRRNPRMAHILLREECRKKFGINSDRRFRQIISRRLFPGCVRCCSRSFT